MSILDVKMSLGWFDGDLLQIKVRYILLPLKIVKKGRICQWTEILSSEEPR